MADLETPQDPATPPAEPTVETPPAAPAVPATPATEAPPEPPKVAPETPPAQQELTDAQWKNLEAQYGLPRQQIIAQYAIAKAITDNDPKTAKLLEKEAILDATESLNKIGVTDFATYKDEIMAELKTPADKRNAELIQKIYFEKKGRAVATGKAPAAAPATPASAALAGPTRIVTGVQHSNPGPVVTTPATAEDTTGLPAFEQHVAKAYGIKSTKEFNDNKEKEVPLQEADWKPTFGRR